MSDPVSEPKSQLRPLTMQRLTIAWPILGGASLLLAFYVLGKWFVGGVSSVPPGDDPMPATKLMLIHALEWGQFAAFVAIFWFVVLRPLIQRRPLGFDGLFVIAALASTSGMFSTTTGCLRFSTTHTS
ncbi:hypothetical protein [Mycolicibacterium moriokaense]|uniref:hypothetical protein n=1 Tax=Mycolicibacterium moriokaense TaxID=39691 RepID=UPI0013D493C4|nr:hypothetical protein [Mycolicibacterium moriokaense]MCV7037849.1 hypothetical protein [Mycolicibacterium moriokaense]